MRFTNPIHPGETLLDDFLLPKGLSQRAFAAELGWPPKKLNELVTGKRGITAESAFELGYRLGTSTELWMYLQINWVLYKAAQRKRLLMPRVEPGTRSPGEPVSARPRGHA